MKIDINPIIFAAQCGGDELKKYFGKILEIEEKSIPGDIRTGADKNSESIIIQTLQKKFPEFNIFSEECGSINNNSEYTFIIDPLDGSNNFVLGIPYFSVSIGLFKQNTAIMGVVYLPILDNIYHAKKGYGSFLNKSQIFVNKESRMKKATISYSCGYINSFQYLEKIKQHLNKSHIKRILELWSPAAEFCLLASGKIEGIINNKNDFFDYAAGKLIASEAGAKITDFSGKSEKDDKNNQFIISNGTKLHQELINVI